MDGHLPTYETFAAPTPHPLFTAGAALAGVVAGGSADRLMVAVCAVADVILGYGVYRLGAAVATRAIGVIAAVLVLSSPTLLDFVTRGYVDLLFLAPVVWAAVALVERPEKPALAMSLLAVAGLLRPEAWTLAGLLWVWEAWRSRSPRAGLLAGALAAPVLWGLSDAVVTGDPLYSLHATSTLAETLERTRGIRHVPGRFVVYLGNMVRPVVLFVGLAGVVLTWRWRARLRGLGVVAALFLAGSATFVVFGAAGVSILPRYVAVPAIAVCLMAGVLLGGWSLLTDPGDRRAGVIGAGILVVFVAGVAFATARSNEAAGVADEVRYFDGVHADLRSVLRTPAVAAARRCRPISTPTYRQLPDVRWMLDLGSDDVIPRADADQATRARRGGIALVAIGRNVRTIGRVRGLPADTNVAPAGFREVARNETFAAYVRCG